MTRNSLNTLIRVVVVGTVRLKTCKMMPTSVPMTMAKSNTFHHDEVKYQ